MKRLLLLAVAALCWSSLPAAPYPVPAARLPFSGSWQGVGFAIPTRTATPFNITAAPYNCDPTGVADSSAGFQLAIDAAAAASSAGSPQRVYVPTGTYRLNSPIVTSGSYIEVYGDVTSATNNTSLSILKGYSTTATASIFTLGQSNYPVTSDTDNDPRNISGTPLKGDTSIVVSSASGITVGKNVVIDVRNDGVVVTNFAGEGDGFNNSRPLPGFVSRPDMATVTMTIASPCVVTWNDHRFYQGQPVNFGTTGALPTGLTANTTYYVMSAGLTTNTFQLASTVTGAAINTSGSQSGVHTGRAPGMRGMRQTVEVTGVSGTTITFTPALLFDLDPVLIPQCSVFSAAPSVGFGIVGIKLWDVATTSTGNDRYVVDVRNSRNFYMYNCETYNGYTGHIQLTYVNTSTIKKTKVHHASAYTANRGYGIRQSDGCSNNLIEDCEVTDVTGGIIIQNGSSGNVVGYCYVTPGQNDSAPNAIWPGLQPAHGAHPTMNLFEGCIAANAESDFTWGSSSKSMFANCQLTGEFGSFSQLIWAVGFGRLQTTGTVIGCKLGSLSYAMVYSRDWLTSTTQAYNYDTTHMIYRVGYSQGNETLPSQPAGSTDARANLLTIGNWNTVDLGIPASESLGIYTSLTSSYYLPGGTKPAWLFSLTWPIFDPLTGLPATITNAAKYRFDNAGNDPPGTGTGGTIITGKATVTGKTTF